MEVGRTDFFDFDNFSKKKLFELDKYYMGKENEITNLFHFVF